MIILLFIWLSYCWCILITLDEIETFNEESETIKTYNF